MASIFTFTGAKIREDEIALKQLMPGVETGSVYVDETLGFSIGETRIAQNSGIPAHAGAQEAVFIVVNGSGVVYTESDDGNVLAEAEVKAGDALHYQAPFFKHRYAAGEDGLAYMVVPVK